MQRLKHLLDAGCSSRVDASRAPLSQVARGDVGEWITFVYKLMLLPKLVPGKKKKNGNWWGVLLGCLKGLFKCIMKGS